jgi:pteridine reductase
MNNKVAFITGSAKRLGEHTAEHLHQVGYKVVIHCLNSVEMGQQLVAKLNQKRPNSADLVQGNLCEMAELPRIVDKATDCFGRLDVLINNASAFYPTPIGNITALDWNLLVGSNMQAPLFLSQYCQPQLQQNNGVIINMVDIHAERPLKEHTVYCMAKAALVAMTKSLAQELAPSVRVNGVAPGAILWPESELDASAKQDILQQVPMSKIGTPQDIAEAIEYLIKARYVTGQIIAVDGGRSITSASKA